MTDIRNTGQELQGQILDTIRTGQEAVTDAIRAWATTVQSLTPSLPGAQVPFADQLPKPSELVANYYDFAEQVLAAQRKFAEDAFRAAEPVLAAKGGASPAAKSGSTSAAAR
jgi:hypothetical protein